MAEWGRTTLEMFVEELQRPVRLDESFDRRVMVKVRRLYAAQRPRGVRAVFAAIAGVSRRPAWAAALAASVVAVASVGIFRARALQPNAGATRLEPVTFVYVNKTARSVSVVGDFNNWGVGDTALVATNHQGVWSVKAPVATGLHRYAFVVDGKEWVADPSALRAPSDDFGLPSSMLVVEDASK
ncbi:MAG: isoamylase early set domain-containing protein [Gemmatimonadota bacterium]